MDDAATGHIVPAFSGRFYTAAKRKAVAATMDDESLLWAYFWPGHLAAAKIIVAAELQTRGFSRDAIGSWTPTSGLIVASTLPGRISWDEYCSTARRKQRFFGAYRAILPFLILVFVIIGQQAKKDENFEALGGTIVMIYIAAIFACGHLFRKLALRTLLLRPFGEEAMTTPLKKFVPRHVGKFGYVYTLSDRNYRPNLFLAIVHSISAFTVMLISPLFRNSLQVARISDAKSFNKFRRFLTKVTQPSVMGFQNGGQAFNIRSTDDWWKICVLVLMHSCDIVVVDLSLIRPGTDWELKQLQQRGMLEKCLFIVGADQMTEAKAALNRYFAGAASTLTVHRYGADGELSNQSEFLADLRNVVLRGGRFAN